MRNLMKLAAAAMAILALSACGNEKTPEKEIEPDPPLPEIAVGKDVEYPESISFDDYEKQREIRDDYPVSEDFIAALSDFSYKTAAKFLTGEENGNYSPASLYYALSVAATGAEGKTAEEFFGLLGIADSETLSAQCENYYRNVYFDNEFGKLKIANSLWISESLVVKEDFAKNAAEKFFASSHSVDFGSTEDMKQISAWISENTNGSLSPEKEPDPEQLLSIINTVYYKDEWTNKFEKSLTAVDDFYLAGGGTVNCDFLNKKTLGSFRKGDGWLAATVALKNSNGMIFVLPDEGVSVSELLSADKLKEILEGGEDCYGEITWQIPKFSFGSRFELTESLEKLGLESAFSALNADFRKISDDELFISDAVQETHIAIDENGVEASAYTELAYAGAAMPTISADMILDRPFIYAIKAGGSYLFVGVVADLTK